MFQVKDITYGLRDSNILCQPKFNKITYSKKTFSYYAPFTPDGESLETGRDRGKFHLSLVVAPSLTFIATIRCTLY